MEQWALFGATGIEAQALAVMNVHSRGAAATEAGQAEIKAALSSLSRPLKVLDAHLARPGQIIGSRFTVADINMAEIVRYVTLEPGALDPYPAVKAWLSACQARPAFKAMWAAREGEPLRA